MHAQRFPFVVVFLVAALVAGVTVIPAQDPAGMGTSTLMGRIKGLDGKSAEGSTVVAYHLSTGETYRSSPTGPDGKYEIPSLVQGYYDLAIETPDGLYVVNQVVNMPPEGKTVANLQMLDPSAAGEAPRAFPGSEQEPSGVAQIAKGSNKKLIGIIAGVGGAAALAAAASGGDDGGGPSSPSQPN
jgi:hypothetical protein